MFAGYLRVCSSIKGQCAVINLSLFAGRGLNDQGLLQCGRSSQAKIRYESRNRGDSAEVREHFGNGGQPTTCHFLEPGEWRSEEIVAGSGPKDRKENFATY